MSNPKMETPVSNPRSKVHQYFKKHRQSQESSAFSKSLNSALNNYGQNQLVGQTGAQSKAELRKEIIDFELQ